MESVISTVIDVFSSYINTAKKVIIVRFAICATFCCLGFFMTSRVRFGRKLNKIIAFFNLKFNIIKGGLFVLNLIDSYVAGYPLLLIGICQIVCVCWIYGTDRLIRDTECMIGKKPQWFWNIWIVCWKFVCPAVLLVNNFALP
jgi:SNF family Na+-dependent transporter